MNLSKAQKNFMEEQALVATLSDMVVEIYAGEMALLRTLKEINSRA